MVRYWSTVDGMWCYTYHILDFNKRCWRETWNHIFQPLKLFPACLSRISIILPLWHIWHVLQWVIAILSEPNQKCKDMCFGCKFDQDVFKNSSGKSLNNIKNIGWQQSINSYVNSYCLMLIMLFVWSFSKPLNKSKYRTNIFWKIVYSAIYLKYWLTNIG